MKPIPELPAELEFDFSPLVPEREFRSEDVLLVIGTSVVVLIALILIGWRISDWWLGRMDTDRMITRLYKRIYRIGRWAGIAAKPGDTAFHYADSLCRSFTQIGEGSYWSDWFLDGVGMVRELTSIYVHALFSSKEIAVDGDDIFLLYKKLRMRMWLFLLFHRAYPYRILRPLLWQDAPLLISLPLEDEV